MRVRCIGTDSSAKALARDRLKHYAQATSEDLRLGAVLDSIPDEPDKATLEAWEEFVWRVAIAKRTRERAARRDGDGWGPWQDWGEPALIDFWGGIEEVAEDAGVGIVSEVAEPAVAASELAIATSAGSFVRIETRRNNAHDEVDTPSGDEPGPTFVFDAERRSPSPRTWVNSYMPAESPSAAVRMIYAFGPHGRDDDEHTLRRVRRRVLPPHGERARISQSHRDRDTRRDGVIFPDSVDFDSLVARGGEAEAEGERGDAAWEYGPDHPLTRAREFIRRRNGGEEREDGRPVASLPARRRV